MIVALGAQQIRKFTAGKIGIATSDEHEVADEASMFVQGAVGFNRGAEVLVRAISAKAAAVVNSLVLEAGVNSLSAFCA